MPSWPKYLALVLLVSAGTFLLLSSQRAPESIIVPGTTKASLPGTQSLPPTEDGASTASSTIKNSAIIMCEKCGKQEATVHVMQYVSQMRGVGKSAPTSTPPPATTPAPPNASTQTNLCEPCAIAAGVLSGAKE